MHMRFLAGSLAATTGLLSAHANAAPLPPTIEIEVGPAASIPITSGSVSLLGVTATGAPLIGTASQPVLQVDGSISGSVFNPLSIEVTEFNLFSLNALASFATAISGTLPPGSSVSWSTYFDPANTPFDTGELLASGSFADASPITSVGFFDPKTATGSATGPFALTEILTVTVPLGETVNFNSSTTASLSAIPEPGSLALIGVGLLGLGLITPVKRRIFETL